MEDKYVYTPLNETIDNQEQNTIEEINKVSGDKLEQIEEIKKEEQSDTSESNCLALTIRKDYKLSILKNSFISTARLSLKVAFSTLILNIIKLFF